MQGQTEIAMHMKVVAVVWGGMDGWVGWWWGLCGGGGGGRDDALSKVPSSALSVPKD